MNGAIKNEFGCCNYAFEQGYVHIYNLFVLPEFRRQGKAAHILQLAINAIRKTGYKNGIQIVTNLKKLKSFYKRMGLEVFEYYG